MAKSKNKKLLGRIVNSDLLAFHLDWWIGPIFIVCFNAFTDSRPGRSAHFSLTALRILPSVWRSQRNKQKMGCNKNLAIAYHGVFMHIKLHNTNNSSQDVVKMCQCNLSMWKLLRNIRK